MVGELFAGQPLRAGERCFQARAQAFTELEPGNYYWCMCGRTKTPPFCDGSHIGTEFTPMEFVIEEPTKVALCNCGLTKTPPYCDGTHGK